MGIARLIKDLPDGRLGETVPDGTVLTGTGSMSGGMGNQ